MGDYEKVQIVLIDDNDLFREGIKQILESSNLFEVVSVGNDFATVLDVDYVQPEIILMDAGIYYANDTALMHSLLTENSQTKIVLFTEKLTNQQVITTLENGVKGYFTKDMNVPSLMEGLKAIQKGRYWIHPNISNNFANEYFSQTSTEGHVKGKMRASIKRPMNLFTEREYQVLELLASGYNNQRISKELEVTQSTVKNHVTNIFVKMNVDDRTQAVIKAVKKNWVEIKYEEPQKI